MKLHKIILLLILLSGFSIEIPAQNSLQNEIGKLEYDTLKRDMVKTKHLDHINISDTSSVSCANYLFRVKEPLYISFKSNYFTMGMEMEKVPGQLECQLKITDDNLLTNQVLIRILYHQ